MTDSVSQTLSLDLYRCMVRIRQFENCVGDLLAGRELAGAVHLSIGMEAVAAGTCAALRADDYMTSTHRGHHHLIAKGGRTDRMLAELFAREGGYNKGKGGSMHIAATERGILGANGIVGGGLAIAAGAALSAQRLQNGRIAVCFFGDGAANQGVFLEALNLAAVLDLPVVYVCENNLYGASTRFGDVAKEVDVAARAAGLGLPGRTVDGQDVLAVYHAVSEAARRARAGEGATLIECKTYRFRSHAGQGRDDRAAEEVEAWTKRDPVALFAARLQAEGRAEPSQLQEIDREMARELEEAVAFAKRSPVPSPAQATSDVYAPVGDAAGLREIPPEEARTPATTRTISYAEALREALAGEMRRDPRVILYGEEIPRKYGALAGEFGPRRVMDMPISESAFTGMGVGAAMTGLRPVVEIMFNDFITLATDPIVNQAAKARYMFGGNVSVPLVVLTSAGGYVSMAAQHSQMLEAWFSHVPGLKVVLPSTPYDAKGLLTAAIRDENPVLVITHKKLLGLTGGVPEDSYVVPIGRADVKRSGTDVTILATSYMVSKALEAAEALSGEGVEAEVVDPRSTLPIDEDTVIASAARTGRVVIVQEAPGPCSVSSELAALVAEKAFAKLKAPIKRIHGRFAPVPFAPNLEREVLPETEDIVRAVREVMRETRGSDR